ncbi:hypothetical protein [Methylomonas sp. MgM2]
MEALNNREIATTIWMLLFAAWAFSKKEVRSSFGSVLDAFAKKVILVPFSLLIIHTLASVWVLSQIGIWNSAQIKNTFLWFIGVAAVSFFRINKIADDPHYFQNAIKDNIKLIVFIEFLVTFYTFNLVVEIVFVPFMALIGALLAVSQTDEKYILVQKALSKLIEIIGISIIIYTSYRLIVDFNDFAQVQTVLDFFVPIALSIFLLPLIYIFHVYMVYEGVFVRMQFSIKDEKLRTYAKRSSIINYKLDLSALRRWADALNREDIVVSSDVDKLHEEIARLEAEEKNPPVVPFELGWSPYKISSVLETAGLKVGHYKKLHEDDWFASSPYLEIGNGLLPNNIAYYLEGNRFAVTKLKLKMNINEEEQSTEAHSILCALASALHLHALGSELNQGFKNAIMEGGDKEDQVKTKLVSVSTERWQNNRGYDVGFSISNI